jgi:hypothetical protein
VGVNVDEAGCDGQPVSVNAHLRRSAFQVSDGRDGVASDTNVAHVRGIARAIHDVGVLNQDVEGLDLKKKA